MLNATTLPQALDEAALHIARLDYSGKRYIADKQVIAESFTRNVYTDECGALIDSATGKVWVVARAFADGVYRYWRAQ
jgi:hypothetical protein